MTASSTRSTRSVLERLRRLRTDYTPTATAEKRETLTVLTDRPLRRHRELASYHDVLCHLRAYPDNAEILRLTAAELARFDDRVRVASKAARAALADSGIGGTAVHMEFELAMAAYLCRAYPTRVDIDWPRFEAPEKLDELLVHLISHGEVQTFDEGDISTQDWMRQARGTAPGTDLEWLVRQLETSDLSPVVAAQLYEAAAVPVIWDLTDCDGSVTGNVLPRPPRFFHDGLLRPKRRAALDIAAPLPPIEPASPRRGKRLIRSALTALAARSREVYAFSHANPEEVYLIDTGRGAQVMVLGVVPERRLNLEGNYGYVVYKNGVPAGYGGATALFEQANTGVNVFDPYRKGESAVLFTSVLRAFRALFDVNRFVVNAYQFGGDNPEAIASGAFWFYHKLGFRPTEPAIARLAASEDGKRRRTPGYRSNAKTLTRLASGDLHLKLPGARKSRFFEEGWLGRIAAGITDLLASRPEGDRRQAIDAIARETAAALGVHRDRWPPSERSAFRWLAPTVSLIRDLPDWSRTDKRALVDVIRKKGGTCERDYVLALRSHQRLQESLAAWCRRRR